MNYTISNAFSCSRVIGYARNHLQETRKFVYRCTEWEELLCDMNQANDLAERLANQHIKVNPAWLEACVRHIRAENGGGGTAFGGDLYKQVYYQLLLTNIAELGMSCLPESAVAAHKLMLKGSYFLQVDSVRDISQPAYSQLLKITNTENQNTGVRADPEEKPFAWQAKPTRMLKLEITDGTRRMEAIEFEPVRCMSVDMLPGVKILLTGPIECRRGTMFLRADNVRVLGGMVESLWKENYQEAVLSRALGRDPPAVPPDRTRTSEEGTDNRSSRDNRAPNPPERASASNLSSRDWNDSRRHNDSRATTIPVANSNSTTMRATDSTVDVDSAWDGAGVADMDSDDALLSQIDLDRLGAGGDEYDRIDDEEDVDQDLLREQLDFQAQAARAVPMQDVVISDEENARDESKPEPQPGTSADGDSKRTDTPPPSLPYIKLSSVVKEGKHPDTPEVVIIKGYIATPTSKLRISPTEDVWQLSAIITDDSASVEVAIDDSLLTTWMGLTATEAKKRRKLSSKFKDFFSERVVQCQEKMRQLNGLLTISFSGSAATLPVLLGYDEWKED